MKQHQTPAQQLAPAQLRALLTLSRELLQTDEADRSLELAGRAMVDLVQPRCALLVVSGEPAGVIELDSRGKPAPAAPDHPLYQAAAALLSEAAGALTEGRRSAETWRQLGPRGLVLAAPPHAALAALAVEWEHAQSEAELDRSRRALSFILELTAAALGKIEARSLLERRLWAQGEQLAHTSENHAVELAKRDEAATELRLLSLTDVLTGLLNRRGFFLHAERLFMVARRQPTKSAVIFADIDGLKRVNDQLGHDMGDNLIRDAADVFRQSFRQADVVSRLGGDEFIAYTLDDEQPQRVLERIRANLEAFNLMQGRPYTVAISAGIVECEPGSGRTLADYVLLADKNMYAQKRSRLH